MEHLQRNLCARHIRFLALGSAIGMGPLYGSASAIQLVGSAAILVYIIDGATVYMVARVPGEMAVRQPVSGSLRYYVRDNLGPFAGFLTGWTYIPEMVIVYLADVTAFGIYMGFWFLEVSQWVWVLGIAMFICGLNLCNVKVLGKMELWLVLIKIAAIGVTIISDAVILFLGVKMNSEHAPGPGNLRPHGGFLPHGAGGLVASPTVVMSTYGGVEIIDIAGGEAQNPGKVIPKAINAVPARILLLYVPTMRVLMAIFPWTGIDSQGSPFVQISSKLGIQFAAAILNLIVISAVISAINSNIFGVGRMMYGMAEQDQVLRISAATSRHGVPWVTVLFMAGALLCGVVLNYLIPENVFAIIASIAIFVIVWIWLMILLSQVTMRRCLSAEEARVLKFKVSLWPIGPAPAIASMLFVISIPDIVEDTRMAFYVGAGWVLLMSVAWYLCVKSNVVAVLAEEVGGV